MDEIVLIETIGKRTRVSLAGGGKVFCRKEDIGKLGLTVGLETTEDALLMRLFRLQSPEAYEAALTLLDFSARTKREISDKLLFKGYTPDSVAYVIERLESAQLVDDTQIAQRIARQGEVSGKGRYAIKQKLKSRGVSDEDCEEALSELSDESQAESCLALARSLMRRYAGEEPRKRKAKLSQALARRGFGWDSIEAALESVSDISE